MARRRKTPEERAAEWAAREAAGLALRALEDAEASREVGFGHGQLPDGRPWLATLLRDGDGHEILFFSFAVGDDALYPPAAVLQRLIDAGLVVPLTPTRPGCEGGTFPDPDRPRGEQWELTVFLHTDDGQRQARPGFAVEPLPDEGYRWH